MAGAVLARVGRAARSALGALLVTAVSVPAAARDQPPPAPFEDSSFEDASGKWRPFRETYESWLGPHHRPPNYSRALVESATFALIGTAYYWMDPLANSADWDFPSFWSKATFRSVRLDNNHFATNHLLHPLAGSSFYGFSRVNGLGVGAAFGYAALASVVWEFGLEYREQASVNDLVFTPFGGAAMGEFFFQLGAYLNSAPRPGGRVGQLGSVTLGIPQYVHDALDSEGPNPEPPLDALGLSSAYSHRFLFGYDYSLVRSEGDLRTLHGFELDATLVAMPGFLRPGRFTKPFADGNFTEMRWRMGFGEYGVDDADLWFASDLIGLYDQNVGRDSTGELEGSAALMALSTALRFNQTEIFGQRDRFGVAHLFGPHAQVWLVRGDLTASWDFRLHPDFAGIHPLAYGAWSDTRPSDGVKTTLERHEYLYAIGYSFHFRSRFSFRGATLAGNLSFGAYDSLENVDRWQWKVTRDVPSSDTVLEYGVSAGYEPIRPSPALRVYVSKLRRSGRMGDAEATLEELRNGVLLGAAF